MYIIKANMFQVKALPLFGQPDTNPILGICRGLLCSYLTGEKLRRVLGHDVQHSGIGVLCCLRFRYQPAQLRRVGLIQLVLVLVIVHAVCDGVIYQRVERLRRGRETA